MQVLILIFLFVALASCNGNDTTATKDTTAQPTPIDERNNTTFPGEPVTDVSGCYVQLLKRDTMVVKLEQDGDELSGKLTFDNYEKDGSQGTVRGRKEGDLIKLVYSFTSEGMNSVMDVYFKVKDNGLIRGVGDVQTKGDKSYFVNPEEVQYPGNGRFEKTACEQVPAKYQ
jgi:hypothetical protein